ncbi:MAG: aldehyde dehydrogenase family protein [Pseudomonadota bacterium]
MLPDVQRFYINGAWVAPHSARTQPVYDPATEAEIAQVALADETDVEAAVQAAAAAFPAYSQTSVEERLQWLEAILAGLMERQADIAAAITAEMGAPTRLAEKAQAPRGPHHFQQTIDALRAFSFETTSGNTLVRREPIGVAALITPWNWPLNQVAAKVAPALATGCTVVLKPSEVAPFDATILAEIVAGVGLPPGVFNMVHGDGPVTGNAMTAHPLVDLVSFTGSTRAGREITKNAADTIKRVALELGGKSPGIVLDDVDVAASAKKFVLSCFVNTGQSCNAQTRLLVPRAMYDEVAAAVVAAAENVTVGAPDSGAHLGPIANRRQYERVQELIQVGIDEGATLLTGGPGLPDGIEAGFYARPTVFGDVSNDMQIAREEVFGPVLAILTYDSEEEAVAIANDSPYGLSSYVWSASHERAVDVARQLRAGMVHINGAPVGGPAPFGGYKQSGNGREGGVWGLEEYLETKSLFGAA